MMSTLKIGSGYRESPMLIVPSAAGFPVVLGSATRRSRGRLPTALGVALAVAVLWVATASCAPASAATAEYQMSAARQLAIHACSVLASRYPQHDWGNTEIYQYRACMAGRGEQE
jgi:hypothetical protein